MPNKMYDQLICCLILLSYMIISVVCAPYGPHQYPSSGQLSYNFPLIKSFSGVLSPNNLLSRAFPVFEDIIVGPTSLAIHNNYLYTGTVGGGVFRCDLTTGNATRIIKIANELCQTKPWDISLCGRALGVRVDSNGNLYFIDAYLGLHEVVFDGNEVRVSKLLSVEEVGGKYMAHLAIDEGSGENGGNIIYVTIASTKRDLNEWPAMIVEPDRTGIVVKFDNDSRKAETIMQGLWYPTSVEMTDDRTAILVSELSARRVVKHFIKGDKKGTTETWAENLPGEAYHLIRSSDKRHETYWLPILNARNVSNPSLLDWLSDKPWVRQEIIDKYTETGKSIEELGHKWKNDRLERLGFETKTLNLFYTQNIVNNYGMLLEMNAKGRILGSIHSSDGTYSDITEAVEGPTNNPYERVLYIGSFRHPFILKLIIPNFSPTLPFFGDSQNGQSMALREPFKLLNTPSFGRSFDLPDFRA